MKGQDRVADSCGSNIEQNKNRLYQLQSNLLLLICSEVDKVADPSRETQPGPKPSQTSLPRLCLLLRCYGTIILYATIKESNEKLKSCTTSWALFMFNLIRKSFTDPSAQCIYYLSNPLLPDVCPLIRPVTNIWPTAL